MYSKKTILFSLLFCSLISVFATEPAVGYKLYGFIRSDLYYNSRQNQESLDGLFNMYPKPIDLDIAGNDKNAIPNSQMLSISTRLGLDFTGTPILGAKSSGKIECDFAGISTSYYLVRLRQAFLKLNWAKTELIVGQTWHPMFSNLQPITPALSVATPFQPFNRSPQIRVKQSFNDSFSALAAISYQMQYMSQGPAGATINYMKTGLLPSLNLSLDYKAKNILFGAGVDGKSLKINNKHFESGAVFAYAGYTHNKFQIRAKSVLGQNLSEYLMMGGYGVSGINTVTSEATYTNINTSSSWLSIAYGTKIQVGLYGGFIKNLGSNKDLMISTDDKVTVYGCGYFDAKQLQMDQLYRVAPHITYNLSNFRLGFEYELTTARYGKIQADGHVINPYSVSNHRAMATISYIF